VEALNGNISAQRANQSSLQAGYSDHEIVNYLAQSRPDLTPKIETAQDNNC
jgi:hypothetical protein